MLAEKRSKRKECKIFDLSNKKPLSYSKHINRGLWPNRT